MMNSNIAKPLIKKMLLIGSTGRNTGKTCLASQIITRYCSLFPLAGLKVTAIQEKNGSCPRGGQGCGVCTSLEGNFELVRELDSRSRKDTAQLLAAGAAEVYWLKVLKDYLKEGFDEALSRLSQDYWIVCESNSMRSVIRPGLFILVRRNKNENIKPSAAGVIEFADKIINFNGKAFDYPIDNIVLTAEGWQLKEDMLK